MCDKPPSAFGLSTKHFSGIPCSNETFGIGAHMSLLDIPCHSSHYTACHLLPSFFTFFTSRPYLPYEPDPESCIRLAGPILDDPTLRTLHVSTMYDASCRSCSKLRPVEILVRYCTRIMARCSFDFLFFLGSMNTRSSNAVQPWLPSHLPPLASATAFFFGAVGTVGAVFVPKILQCMLHFTCGC